MSEHRVPNPPRLQTGPPGAPADHSESFRRGWAIRYETLLHRLALLEPEPGTPVIIVREQSGGVWKIKDVRRASDGAIEVIIYPS